jgi:hypothetical protein
MNKSMAKSKIKKKRVLYKYVGPATELFDMDNTLFKLHNGFITTLDEKSVVLRVHDVSKLDNFKPV